MEGYLDRKETFDHLKSCGFTEVSIIIKMASEMHVAMRISHCHSSRSSLVHFLFSQTDWSMRCAVVL